MTRGGPRRLRDGGVMEMRGIGKVFGCREGEYDDIRCSERSVHDKSGRSDLLKRANHILLPSTRHQVR